jgi:pre-mRNA-splicing factor SYF1
VYEQDLLRDAGSVKPWLAYIEFKQQHGTLYEQAFVCPPDPLYTID